MLRTHRRATVWGLAVAMGAGLATADAQALTRPANAAIAPTRVTTPTGATTPVEATTPRLRWHPCEQDGTAECATLQLPVDWARPGGPTFGLAVARRKAQ